MLKTSQKIIIDIRTSGFQRSYRRFVGLPSLCAQGQGFHSLLLYKARNQTATSAIQCNGQHVRYIGRSGVRFPVWLKYPFTSRILIIFLPRKFQKFQNSRRNSILNIVINQPFPKRITQALPVGNRRVGYRKYILPNPYPRGRFIPNTRTQLVPALGYPYLLASLVLVQTIATLATSRYTVFNIITLKIRIYQPKFYRLFLALG